MISYLIRPIRIIPAPPQAAASVVPNPALLAQAVERNWRRDHDAEGDKAHGLRRTRCRPAALEPG